jgi:hypothetical protein
LYDPRTWTVWLHCRATLRGDVLEVTRDRARIENIDGGDLTSPRPDACDVLPAFGKHSLAF